MKNITITIPDNSKKAIHTIIETLNRKGYECYLVGGSVRDLLLGLPVYDFDFATNARPEIVTKLFRRVIPTGIKHGTVSIIFNHKAYEVTTYRADGTYSDGRRPDSVAFSQNLEEDVLRRDFTINGLAYDLSNDKIIDYVDGIEDLKKHIIRTIGNPLERFSEDGLRPLRACRFSARLDFVIEDETFQAIEKSLDITSKVAIERFREELVKMLEADIPSIGLENMRKSGLLKLILPELQNCYDVPQNRFHKYDIYYHSVYSCDASPADNLVVRLAALLHDIGKVITRRETDGAEATFYNHEMVGARITKKLLKRLKFSNEIVARVTHLVTNHMFHYIDEWTDGAVRRFVRKVGLDNIEDLFSVRLADREGSGFRTGLPEPVKILVQRIEKVIEQDNAFSVRDLKINGNIIMEKFKVAPGPLIGNILNELLELVLDDPELNNEKDLLEKAEEIHRSIIDE